MSELHVPLTTVTEVKPHPNADKLDIAIIQGWQVIVSRDSMAAGDSVIYVGPDCIVPDEWAVRWGVKDYLSKGERVKAIKLRGEPSFGFAVPISDDLILEDVQFGDDVSARFGITKYVPLPPRQSRSGGPAGDSMAESPYFSRYTDIVNLRHYPSMFDDTAVVVTEKIHGTNSRIGIIDGPSTTSGTRVAGSHRVQRRHPDDRSHLREFEYARYEKHYDDWIASLPYWKRWLHDTFGIFSCPRMTEVVNKANPGTATYWLPWEISGVETMLEALAERYQQVILYGEIYGPAIQALGYGVPEGKVEYRAFDLMLDGKYQDYRTFAALCSTFGVPMAPLLATGNLSYDDLKALTEGPTTLNDGPHLREGIVVRSTTETVDPRRGRMVSKFVADSYLCSKGDAAEDLSNDIAEAIA